MSILSQARSIFSPRFRQDKSAKENLLDFKKVLDVELEKYLTIKTQEAASYSKHTKELCDHITDLTLRGGKRVRAALLYYSYLAHGGKDCEQALKAAMSMELSETYLLIHDDVIDEDRLRRGGETIQVSYEEMSKVKYRHSSNHHHFGLSMAVAAGDIACGMSNEIIADCNFEPKKIFEAMKLLNETYILESYGQGLDILSERRDDIKHDDVMLTYKLKTVPYTFDTPVKMGAILAGANASKIKSLEDYAVPLGIAFQIQDDILGMFGTEEKIGKPVTSDLKEGKKTLLILDALEKADKIQKEIIEQNLGNKKVTQRGLNEVRAVITETGALEKSKLIAKSLVAKSLTALEKNNLKHEGKDFLLKIAEYMVNRES